MDNVKVGQVGLGGMGYGHYLAYKAIKEAKLVAICDIRIEELKDKIDDKNIHLYKNLNDMLENEKLDVIDIVTPSYLHADMIIECLDKNYNVMCEKPLTLSKEDIDRISLSLNNSNKIFMVGHVVRFMKPYIYLKEIINTNELGKLIRIDFKRISTIPTWSYKDWMRNEKLSGGVGLDLSIHDIDFVQSVLGNPIDMRCIYHPIKDNSSYILSTLIYKDCVISCEGCWYNTEIPFSSSFLAVFDNGYLKSDNGKLIKNGVEINLNENKSDDSFGINISNDDAYSVEISYFIDCVKNNKKQNYITFDSSANSVILMNKLYEIAKIV